MAENQKTPSYKNVLNTHFFSAYEIIYKDISYEDFETKQFKKFLEDFAE